jgi:hypothetical protein
MIRRLQLSFGGEGWPRADRCWLLPVVALLMQPVSTTALPLELDPDVEIYLAGSSAQDKLLEGLMRLRSGRVDAPNICREGTLDIYTGLVAGTRQRLFYCETDRNIAGVEQGSRLAVYKSSGGSGEGVAPLVAGEAVPFLSIDGMRDVGCAASTRRLPSADLAAYTEHRDCGGPTRPELLHAGISDLEPALLIDDASRLEMHSLAQLVWGLPVSKNLRNALQAVQGLVPAEVAHDDPSREAQDAMPSLSSTQVSSIFAGRITEWSALFDSDGLPITESRLLAKAPPDNPDLSGTSPGAYWPDERSGGRIYICRRINSSGTQIAYGTHYLRQRCTRDAYPFAMPDDGSDLDLGGDPEQLLDVREPAGRVFAGLGSGDVRACLDLHDDHNRWAIGMLSTENLGNNASREFRHIRIDGFSPDLLNAHNGRWRHVSSASMHWLRDRGGSGEVDEVQPVLEFIADYMGQPAVLHSLNRNFVHPWGQGGYLAITTRPVTGPMSADDLVRLPVAGVSSERRGEPQNCQLPLLTGGSSILLR